MTTNPTTPPEPQAGETPRTNAVVARDNQQELWDHAYQLERELNAAILSQTQQAIVIATWSRQYQALATALATSRDENQRLKTWIENHIKEVGDVRKEMQDLREGLATSRAETEAARAELAKANAKLDALLNHCPDPECSECAKIICPHGEPLHFHHDGCPACHQQDPADDDPIYAPAP